MVDPRKKKLKVKVHRMNVDSTNRDLIIQVNDMGCEDGKTAFFPGQEVFLTLAQINILKNAVEKHVIPIEPSSGIMSTADPKKAAEEHFPGFTARFNRVTQNLEVVKSIPNYAVEVVDFKYIGDDNDNSSDEE